MKIFSSLAALAATVGTFAAAQDCTTGYQQTVTVPDGVPITLELTADVAGGMLRGQATYAAVGWVGFAISPSGGMIGSQAVIGSGDAGTIGRYQLGGYSPAQVTLIDGVTAPDPSTESFVQNETHTVLTFNVPLDSSEDEFDISTDLTTTTNFLVAGGTDNTLAYHAVRAPLAGVMVEPCGGSAPASGAGAMDTGAMDAMDLSTLAVGDTVTHEGYVLDQFCINEGVFLDQPGLASLENPDKHTVHCLIDARPCIATPFELLQDPAEGEVTWTRAFVFDEESKNQVVALAKSLGGPTCTECDGTGTLQAGFRVLVEGTVTALADADTGVPATLSITSLEAAGMPPTTYEVGQEVTFEGYVTDQFCIERGTFLDTGLVTMENANRHTLHCLLDPPPCLETPFEILMDPNFAAGDTMFQRGFVLDDASKEQVIALGREVGNCDTCSAGAAGQFAGFRVRGTASVSELPAEGSEAGPVVSVSQVESVGQYSVGQMVMVEGYIIDTFCILQGVFLDTGLPTLIDADKHTVHCLIDAPPCIASAYEVVFDPVKEGDLYSRAFTLNQASKDIVVALAKEVGDCSDCDGTGSLKEGFRVKMYAEVVDNMWNATTGSGPVINIINAETVLPEDYTPPGLDVAVGDVISIEGFVMDNFCIERGTLLDAPTIVTLEEPNLHSFHCLLDVPQCVASNYEILMDPLPGQSMYRRVLTLDEASKEMVIAEAQAFGSCDTCSGTKATHGFRANITATVLDLGNEETGAPPMVAVSDIEPVIFITDSCTEVTLDVGDRITVTGFVMDYFCIERGTLLDAPTIVTLEEPNLHSVHCLIDVQQCADTNYEVLLDPGTCGNRRLQDGDVPMYTRGFVLDDAGKALIRELAKEVGVCSDCAGTGDLERGFRAQVQGTVTALGTDGEPPVISVQMATPVTFDGTTEPETEAPALPSTPAPGTDTGTTDAGIAMCDLPPPVTQTFSEVPITLTYELGVDAATGMGTFSAEVVYAGQGWVGFGISADGKMQGSLAVIGLPDQDIGESNPGKYNLNGYTSDMVVLADQQTLVAGNIAQNATHTTLTFTKLLTEPDELAINPSGDNFFLLAAGSSNELAYHAVRHPFTETLTCTCCGPAEGAGGCELPPVAQSFSEVPITLTYELGIDGATGMGTISAEVVYEGLGWVGFAISAEGKMAPGSLAVIGLPDEDPSQTNPGKYDLGGYAATLVTLLPETQQTLLAGNIEQNETHTTLTFTKFLSETDEPAINPSGDNFFLVAAGTGNELAYHGTIRHPFTETLACPREGGGLDVAVGDVISIEGFVMDNFCIERGTLLDAPTIVTLEEPNLHSFHCLLDVPQCVASNYEILMDPLPGESMYRRVLTLDEASKEMVIAEAQAFGSCDTCSGTKATHGFRANITATVLDLGNEETGAPPMVAVSDIEPVIFITDSCTEVTLDVGDRITVTGFVMDYFCIERGTLLDAPTIVTLEEPNLHSVHCLIDVQQCADTNYEVLLDPGTCGNRRLQDGDVPMYTRGFVLDDAGKALIRELAKEVGVCSDCAGTGDLERGFRAQVQGTVTALGTDGEPPVISVQMATPVTFDGTTEPETEAPAVPSTPAPGEAVDCTQFQVTYPYPGTMVTLEYVMVVDEATGEGNYTGRVTYEGQGWVGFAVSPDGSMVGSEAIIGLPGQAVGEGNPGVYDLNAKSNAGVVLADSARQSIILEANIVQNDTHTEMTFVRTLAGQVPIVPNEPAFFLAASGSGNDLAIHGGRGSLEVVAAPCTAEGGGAGGVIGGGGSGDRKESHFQAHGWMAVIAWGVLVPIAIGNSLCRHLIPVQGLWFEVHRAFNSLAIILTICLFAVVVNALETTSNDPQHFKPIEGGGAIGKHKTIGLVVFILALIQGIGGMLRPHLPSKNDDGTDAEPKSTIRVMWEFLHKGSGYVILAMAWYQCHSGLQTYALNFNAKDYSNAFWGVTGSIAGIVVVGALTRFIMPAEAVPKQNHMSVPDDEAQALQGDRDGQQQSMGKNAQSWMST